MVDVSAAQVLRSQLGIYAHTLSPLACPMSSELTKNQRPVEGEDMEPVEYTSRNSHSNLPLDIMDMGDLLDDNNGLGPYLAAELFDASNFDALMLPLQGQNNT